MSMEKSLFGSAIKTYPSKNHRISKSYRSSSVFSRKLDEFNTEELFDKLVEDEVRKNQISFLHTDYISNTTCNKITKNIKNSRKYKSLHPNKRSTTLKNIQNVNLADFGKVSRHISSATYKKTRLKITNIDKENTPKLSTHLYGSDSESSRNNMNGSFVYDFPVKISKKSIGRLSCKNLKSKRKISIKNKKLSNRRLSKGLPDRLHKNFQIYTKNLMLQSAKAVSTPKHSYIDENHDICEISDIKEKISPINRISFVENTKEINRINAFERSSDIFVNKNFKNKCSNPKTRKKLSFLNQIEEKEKCSTKSSEDSGRFSYCYDKNKTSFNLIDFSSPLKNSTASTYDLNKQKKDSIKSSTKNNTELFSVFSLLSKSNTENNFRSSNDLNQSSAEVCKNNLNVNIQQNFVNFNNHNECPPSRETSYRLCDMDLTCSIENSANISKNFNPDIISASEHQHNELVKKSIISSPINCSVFYKNVILSSTKADVNDSKLIKSCHEINKNKLSIAQISDRKHVKSDYDETSQISTRKLFSEFSNILFISEENENDDYLNGKEILLSECNSIKNSPSDENLLQSLNKLNLTDDTSFEKSNIDLKEKNSVNVSCNNLNEYTYSEYLNCIKCNIPSSVNKTETYKSNVSNMNLNDTFKNSKRCLIDNENKLSFENNSISSFSPASSEFKGFTTADLIQYKPVILNSSNNSNKMSNSLNEMKSISSKSLSGSCTPSNLNLSRCNETITELSPSLLVSNENENNSYKLSPEKCFQDVKNFEVLNENSQTSVLEKKKDINENIFKFQQNESVKLKSLSNSSKKILKIVETFPQNLENNLENKNRLTCNKFSKFEPLVEDKAEETEELLSCNISSIKSVELPFSLCPNFTERRKKKFVLPTLNEENVDDEEQIVASPNKMINSNIFPQSDSTFINSTISKNPGTFHRSLYLTSGKKWRRSFIVLKNYRENGFNTDALDNENKGRCWRKNVEELISIQNDFPFNHEIEECNSFRTGLGKIITPSGFEDADIISEDTCVGNSNRARFSLCINIKSNKNESVSSSRTKCSYRSDDSSLNDSNYSVFDDEKFQNRDSPKCSRLSSSEYDFENNLCARDIVLKYCQQNEPLPIEECFTDRILQDCKKIGEGVYGEVFIIKRSKTRNAVLKIIPIEGDQLINGDKQKKFNEVLSEIIIAVKLSKLRKKRSFYTECFAEVKRCWCVFGRYPRKLIDIWNKYDEEKGSENDSPKIFECDQLYIIFELNHGGENLETFTFNNAQQTLSVFLQATNALAVAEQAFMFEHRDLHWGNVLVSKCRKKEIKFVINDEEKYVKTSGIKVTIIDYTLSRMSVNNCVVYNNIGLDYELFTAEGDFQFEIYRLMKIEVRNIWDQFVPKTNILWLKYILDKLINNVKYRRNNTKIHAQCMEQLEEFYDKVLTFSSSYDMIQNMHLIL